jgi:hypothetical protein
MAIMHHFPGCHNVAAFHDVRLYCIAIDKKRKESNYGKNKNVELVVMNSGLKEIVYVGFENHWI